MLVTNDPMSQPKPRGIPRVSETASHCTPRRRILRTSLSRPDLATAQVIVPATEAVITSMHAAQDGAFSTQRQRIEELADTYAFL
jgi:hypothetical protein